MKICFLMPSHWSATLGGAELQVRAIMNYIREHSAHDVFMICRNSAQSQDNGMQIHRTSGIQPLARYLKFSDYFSVQRLLNDLAPDVVYTRIWSPYVAFAAQYCNDRNAKLIYHIAHIEDVSPLPAVRSARALLRRIERPIYDWGLKRADAVIAQAAYQTRLLQEHYGVHCTAIIPNAHDVPKNPVKHEETLTAVWVGSVKTVKRPELFIELARQCKGQSNCQFLMIGGANDPAHRRLLASAQGLPNLSIVGEQPIEFVNRYLENAHLYINTSDVKGEGFPNTFIQAWLRSVPVISLNANPDNIFDAGELGVCVNGSFDDLVSTTLNLLRDSNKRHRLAEICRSYAVKTHSLANFGRILALMESLHLPEPRPRS